MGRLIDADRLKAHYCWWAGGSKEMSIDEAKKTFDTIIDVQPTVDIDAITESHEQIGYDKGFRDGYAQATSEVRHGRWIKNEDRSGWHCSCCGKDDLYAYPYTENNERELQDFYCPNCGAKMDGERREDADNR